MIVSLIHELRADTAYEAICESQISLSKPLIDAEKFLERCRTLFPDTWVKIECPCRDCRAQRKNQERELETQSEAASISNVATIPAPALEITSTAVLNYLLVLRSWLIEARLELLPDVETSQELLVAPARYVISDVTQLHIVGAAYAALESLRKEWDALVQLFGGDWNGFEASCCRQRLLTRIECTYRGITHPEEAQARADKLEARATSALPLLFKYLGGGKTRPPNPFGLD